MRALLLGGAPGIGKSEVAAAVLAEVAPRTELVQWVDVDALWRHQPWRVDETTRAMLHANLTAVAAAARDAGVGALLVTWVFQSPELHEVVRACLPAGTAVCTVQLLADEAAWRRRVAADPRRPPIDAFYESRYRDAQRTPVDHAIDTTALDVAAIARVVAGLLAFPAS